MALTYDQLLERKVGAFGPWQIVALSAIIFCGNSPLLQFQQLALTTPQHFCRQPELEAAGWTQAKIRNATVPKLDNELGFDPCRQFNFSAADLNASTAEEVWNTEDRPVEPCRHGWSYEEGTDIFERSMPRDFDLVCERKVLVSWCGSAFALGMIPAPSIAGFLSDRYGRRLVCVTSSVLAAAAAVATSVLSTTWPVFWIFRFLVGLVASSAYVTSFMWGAECTSLGRQNTFNIMYHLLVNHVADALYIGLAAALRDWRWLHASLAVPHVLSLALLLFVPESPRWLLSVGRPADAAKALGRIAAGNRRHGTDFAALLEAESIEVDVAPRGVGEAPRAAWKLLFTERNYRFKLLAFIYLWMGANLSYYGLFFFSVRLKGNPFVIAAIASVIGFPFVVAKFLIFNLLSRRAVLVGSHLLILVIASACALCLCLLPGHVVNVVLATLGVGTSFFVFMVLYTIVPGIFPTATQNLALGIFFGLSRIGMGASTFVEKLDTFTGWRWLPAAILAGVMAVGLLVSILVPLSESQETEVAVPIDMEEQSFLTKEQEKQEAEGKKQDFLTTNL